MQNAKCKICRRLGEKLFLKGEKCLSPKCLMLKKAYPPGQKAKRGKGGSRKGRSASEYSKELTEKQKLRYLYNCQENQFRNYIKKLLKKRKKEENIAELLIEKLESRLDNVVFRLGFAASRSQARQLVGHGHFLVNGRRVNIPSFLVKKGDKIKLKDSALKSVFFQKISVLLKKHQLPSWLSFDRNKLEGQVKGKPSLGEVTPPVEIAAVFEYYSR